MQFLRTNKSNESYGVTQPQYGVQLQPLDTRIFNQFLRGAREGGVFQSFGPSSGRDSIRDNESVNKLIVSA
jgi:hypothetical protein